MRLRNSEISLCKFYRELRYRITSPSKAASNSPNSMGLPLQFWANAIDTVVYLINRGPSSSLDGGVREEAWTGKKVNYSLLNPFGCEAFVHINK